MFDFTLNRGRDGPKYFLKDYRQVLLADAYGGYNGVVAGNEITRAGCWVHMRRKVIEAEKVAPEIAREAIELVRALYVVEKRARDLSAMARLELRQKESAPVLAQLRKKLLEWKEQLLPKHPMADAVNYALGQWTELNVFCSDGAVAHRQQRLGARDEAGRSQSKEQPLRGQSARRQNGGDPGQSRPALAAGTT